MSGRNFEKTFQQCRCGMQQVHRAQSKRPFSGSSIKRRKGHLPSFSETDVPELNSLFETMRSRIFIPAYLQTAQRKLVFQSRHHAMLRSEPFDVDVGSETFQLEPLDATKDIPDRWRSLLRAMQLMGSESSNWSNLLGLLRGMHTAGKRWRSAQLETIIKMASNNGMQHLLVEAIREAPRTGLLLKDIRVAREMMWACRIKAMQGEWDAESTDKALRYAEQVGSWLQDEERTGKQQDVTELQAQADIIAVPLELVAYHSLKHLDGQEGAERVKVYVERLLPQIVLTNQGVESFPSLNDSTWAATADYELMRWVPVLNGLTLASEVLGDQLPQPDVVSRILDDLRTKLKDAKAIVAGSSDPNIERRRGLKWFAELEASSA